MALSPSRATSPNYTAAWEYVAFPFPPGPRQSRSMTRTHADRQPRRLADVTIGQIVRASA